MFNMSFISWFKKLGTPPKPVVDIAAPHPTIGTLGWYKFQWDRMICDHTKHDKKILLAVNAVVNNLDRYKSIEKLTGVPFALVAAIHYRECDFDFKSYLGNGDPLSKKSVNVPAGRGPFVTWEAGALDALKYDHLDGKPPGYWTIEQQLMFAEKFNGGGYLKRALPSPYVWGCSSICRTTGVYVSDGKFSNTAPTDTRLGVAILLKELSLSFPA